jgi:hypothetical protein
MNYYYQRNKFVDFKSNILFHELLDTSDSEFESWAKTLREEVTNQWDEFGNPPVIGKNYDKIISSLGKLKSNECNFLETDLSDDNESLGIVKNFNKDASVVNQFFPTMLKTKISSGKTAEGGLSIYDYFGDPDMEDKFVTIMRRAVRRDSMYVWSRSLVTKKDENPFWNGQSGYEFIKDVKDGKVFTGKWENYDIYLTKSKDSTFDNYGTFNDDYIGFTNIYLSADEVNELVDTGYLNSRQVSNIKKIEESSTSKVGKVTKFSYMIRWYDKTEGLFPNMLRVIRLSCGQAAVNFPALTAKLLYEKYTSHIEQKEPLVVYDSSSGWGGRILGAMSSRKKIHYVGTDPNPDNYLTELGKSRYEYVADFYNKNCIDNHSDKLVNFFDVETESNTYELFQDGSELIENNKEFQKYKGKLDFSFTSPPYFNREQYSQDENQSFKAYSEYEDWRENFLKPTLTTIYEYLKNDRYIIWNIASIKIGENAYFPLEEDSVEILKELGCEYKGKLKMLMTRMVGLDPSKTGIKNSVKHNGKVYKYEPMFVFHKK